MNRKEFFRSLFLGGSSLLVFGSVVRLRAREKREIRLCSPYIAGYQFYDGEKGERTMKVNDSLILKREPGNSHDCYAIEVFHNNDKLGYLPRDENKVVARMMDQEINVHGRIVKIKPDSPTWKRVKMKVFYDLA